MNKIFYLLLIVTASGCSMDANINPSLAESPCDNNTAAIGYRCPTGAIFAGVFDGGHYMVMPEACNGTTNNPTCLLGGIDTLSLPWNDGTTNFLEALGIEILDTGNASTRSSPLFRGNINTAALGLEKVPVTDGPFMAAKYCEDLVYAGYEDWYLPSKSELAYLYCKANVANGSHNPAKPEEDPNCVDYGGKESLLPGFADDTYWSSTGRNSLSSWQQDFKTGGQTSMYYYGDFLVRCVRRY